MGLRLRILSWWTPNYILQKELANVSNQTTTALKMLLQSAPTENSTETQKAKNIQAQRAAMAQTHVKLVEVLVTKLGYEKAVTEAREALFLVGESLGKQARSSLGVGDSPQDMTRAAKILYRVLGIDFHLEWIDDTHATAVIDHCALAQQYSKLTCEVLSATDEGVIKGLQPNVTMKFKEYLTSGCNNCRANIQFGHEETPK